MNKRVKELRKYLKMSQEDFGKLLGITKSGVSDIESGRRKVTEQHIFMLKSQKNVNEQWLRTGEGKMFVEQTRDKAAIDLINILTSLNSDDWKLLIHTAATLAKKKEVIT